MHARVAHRRGSARPRFDRTLVALSLCLAGLVLAAAFVGVTAQLNALDREKAAYQADIAAARAEQAALKEHIGDQQTPDYVVDRARDYGYIRPNESLIGVQRDSQGSASSAGATKLAPSRLARWITFFFGSR